MKGISASEAPMICDDEELCDDDDAIAESFNTIVIEGVASILLLLLLFEYLPLK